MRDANDYKNTIEFASEKVHNAWMDEKLSQGFHSPYECPIFKNASRPEQSYMNKFRKNCEKCHTDLYPYPELPENIKEYDRVTVVAVLNAVNYFENKTCADCGYFDPVENVCFGEDREHKEQADNPICGAFAPKGLVEVTTP